jgi:hypothetical protein
VRGELHHYMYYLLVRRRYNDLHMDTSVVTNVVEDIESQFGKMTVMRGKGHTFLGMDVTLNDDRTFTIAMPTYIKEVSSDFNEDVSAIATSPGGGNLFTVDDTSLNTNLLDRNKADLFHSIVAKLFYVAGRGRSEIMPTVAFLCTRVSR